MFLIKLDETNTVIQRLSLGNLPSLPTNTRLDETYMITALTTDLGQVWDDETGTFGTAPRKRWITKLAFDSRFTMSEAVALKMAQAMPTQGAEETNEAYQQRCVVAASVQVLQSRLNMASYIDLSRDDTRGGVLSTETMGLLTAGRALEILDGEIAEHEYHPSA